MNGLRGRNHCPWRCRLLVKELVENTLDSGIYSIRRIHTRNRMDLVTLVIVLNDGEARLCKGSEAFLDGLDVIIGPSTGLTALHQALQHDLFGTLKVQCEFAWDNLESSVWSEKKRKNILHHSVRLDHLH